MCLLSITLQKIRLQFSQQGRPDAQLLLQSLNYVNAELIMKWKNHPVFADKVPLNDKLYMRLCFIVGQNGGSFYHINHTTHWLCVSERCTDLDLCKYWYNCVSTGKIISAI